MKNLFKKKIVTFPGRRILLRLFFIGILANYHMITFAQDSSRLRISLLTCSPGDELYSIFGHSALRVIDSNSVTDHVYNYGTFNFDDKNFYLKFVRGKLLYYMSIEQFTDFRDLYQYTNRGMTEQVLDLSAEEKQVFKQFLVENLKEENKFYQYDFFFDNCTTRVRDLIVKYKQPAPLLPAVRPPGMRFRQAIHEYLDRGKQPWSKLGIDILLGAKTDRVMTAAEQQFLPDNLMMALDSNRNGRLALSSQNLYPLQEQTTGKPFFTPLISFSILLLVFVLLHFTAGKKWPLLMAGLDGMLFFLTGLLGFILVFMWVATDHSMTKNNYNLLWALPTHLFISFFISSKKLWVKRYLNFTFLAGVLLLFAWAFIPQQLNTALVPFVLLLMFRAWVRK
ncbi:MAG: DUF4105 domain-containing protein [Rhizobacter sp.]|nr:DUF4105 domain-containing protein [Ferruginibacter sp.]